MDEIEQAPVESTTDETPELTDAEIEETEEAPKEEKKTFSIEQKFARVTRLAQKYAKELGIEPPQIRVESAKESKGNPSESDLEALLLEVKGIQEADDVALFEKWKADTGRSARQILSNEIFQKELSALRHTREVSAATPGATKRGGNQAPDLATAIARFEQKGELPDDFELRSAVVNALVDKDSGTKPAWK